MFRLKYNTEKSLIFYLGQWNNRKIDDLDMKIERATTNFLIAEVEFNKIEKQVVKFDFKLPTNSMAKTFGISQILHQLLITDANKSFLKCFRVIQIYMGIQSS